MGSFDQLVVITGDIILVTAPILATRLERVIASSFGGVGLDLSEVGVHQRPPTLPAGARYAAPV